MTKYYKSGTDHTPSKYIMATGLTSFLSKKVPCSIAYLLGCANHILLVMQEIIIIGRKKTYFEEEDSVTAFFFSARD